MRLRRFALCLILLLAFYSQSFATGISYPLFKAWDYSTGQPLVGGLLWSYVPGTSTPSVTYSDPACTVANTNPVVLNSVGEAPVYIKTANKLTLEKGTPLVSGHGPQMWTIDNVTTGNLWAYASFMNGVFYTTGNLPWVSVKDFGAVGDDTNNDTIAINSALATGLIVYFPAGTYKYVGNLTVTTGGIIGDGWGTDPSGPKSVLNFYNTTDTTQGAINTRLASAKGTYFRIENMQIQASSWDNTTGCLGYGVDVEAPIIMRNVYVWGFKKSNLWFHQGMSGNGPYQSLIENVLSAYSGQHGCLVGNGANVLTFVNYQGKWNGAPSYDVAPSVAGVYDGFHVDQTADGESYPAYTPSTLSIVGGDCSYNSRYGWNIRGLEYSVVNPGYAEGNLRVGGYQCAYGDLLACTVNFTSHTPALIEDVGGGMHLDSNSVQIWAGGQFVPYFKDYSFSQRGNQYLLTDATDHNCVVRNPVAGSNRLKAFRPQNNGTVDIGEGVNAIDFSQSATVLPYTRYEYTSTPTSIIGAASNGSGLIRLTLASDDYQTGQRLYIKGVVGVTNANGQVWFVTRIGSAVYDLVGSTFAGTFTDNSDAVAQRCISTQRSTSYPTTGTSAVGDTIWNTTPTASGVAGWVCTTGGANPGTAKFAPIALGSAVP